MKKNNLQFCQNHLNLAKIAPEEDEKNSERKICLKLKNTEGQYSEENSLTKRERIGKGKRKRGKVEKYKF